VHRKVSEAAFALNNEIPPVLLRLKGQINFVLVLFMDGPASGGADTRMQSLKNLLIDIEGDDNVELVVDLDDGGGSTDV
jgi:hypothetical protein